MRESTIDWAMLFAPGQCLSVFQWKANGLQEVSMLPRWLTRLEQFLVGQILLVASFYVSASSITKNL